MAFAHRIKLAAVAGALAAVAVPAAAQVYSDGFKFLEAVEKKDRAKLNEIYNKSPTVIDARDITKGHTALHLATQRRDLDWIQYLIGLKANPNLTDKQGVTPLMLASQMGWVEGVSLLTRNGARVDVANNAGETPLISAVHRRDMAMLRVLLRAGADPERPDNSGRSARDYASVDNTFTAILNEINRLTDKGEKAKSAQVYGPSF
ncbi:ankyrin repeat domain-containing protein [Tsuneonella sp. HG222]